MALNRRKKGISDFLFSEKYTLFPVFLSYDPFDSFLIQHYRLQAGEQSCSNYFSDINDSFSSYSLADQCKRTCSCPRLAYQTKKYECAIKSSVRNLIIICAGAVSCEVVCTGLLHRSSLWLNKRRYPVLSVNSTLLKMMDSSSVGHIMLSKEEKSSFILKQQCQLQLQLRSPDRVCASTRSQGSGRLNTETPTERIQIGGLPHIFMPFNKPNLTTKNHTNTYSLRGGTCK